MPDTSPPNADPASAALLPQQALAVRPLDEVWKPRQGIIVDQARTYGCGIGSEYVYCFSYRAYIEVAALKREARFRVKVGSAKGDPIERIYAQFHANKTVVPEPVVLLLVFRAPSAKLLERWLHERLDPVRDAAGSEWFYTNPEELVQLFQEHLRTAVSLSDEVAEPAPRDSQSEVGRRPAVAESPRNGETRNDQGHRIQAVMNSGQYTPEEIAEKSHYSLARVRSHVYYEISKGRAELNGKGQVAVLRQPPYRSYGPTQTR